VDNLNIKFSESRMHYVWNGEKFLGAVALSKTGIPIVLNEAEVDINNIIPARERYAPSIHELTQTYNCKEWKDDMEEMICEAKREIENLRNMKPGLEREAQDRYRNYNDQEVDKMVEWAWVDYQISYQQEKILRLNKLLYNAKQVIGKDKERDFKILIERAKQVPISDLLDIPYSQFIQCIFHKEKTASMKYNKKTNTVHCFGACGTTHDSIDVVRQLHGCDFKTALQILNH